MESGGMSELDRSQLVGEVMRNVTVQRYIDALILKYHSIDRKLECNQSRASHQLHPLHFTMGSAIPYEVCEQASLHVALLGYAFIPIFLLALIGNAISLFVYGAHEIRKYLAIRMLCARLVLCTVTMLCVLPSSLRTMGVWGGESRGEDVYWHIWPVVSFCGNVGGFTVMWLTVIMGGESYMHVFHPMSSRFIYTTTNYVKVLISTIAMGCLLSVMYPLNRHSVRMIDECNEPYMTVLMRRTDELWLHLESVHSFANLFLSLALPMLLLIFMTSAIVFRMSRTTANVHKHFSNEKRTICRLSIITTVLQLIEFPNVIFFACIFYYGNDVYHTKLGCTMYTLGVFLGLLSMSFSFYVYMLFSHKFRNLILRNGCKALECLLPPSLLGKYVVRSVHHVNGVRVGGSEGRAMLSVGGVQMEASTVSSRVASSMEEDTFL